MQACATTPSWCGAGDTSQVFVFARQALHHQLSYPLGLQLAFSTGLLVMESVEKPAKALAGAGGSQVPSTTQGISQPET